MIANYQYLDDENLQELKNFNADKDENFDAVESWNEAADILLDIDKMWDVLHFVFTGVSSFEPIENNPLSEAVVGVSHIDDVEEFMSYTEKSRIKDIVAALDHFDIKNAMEKFSMKKCQKADIYPDVWDYEEEADEIKEEIMDYFQNMKDFYKKILEAEGNVLITIY